MLELQFGAAECRSVFPGVTFIYPKTLTKIKGE